MMRWLALALLVCAVSAAAAQTARETLRSSVERNEIVPLISIVQWVESRYRGQIVEVELEVADAALQYEVELLTPKGNVIEFRFDARTGAFLSVEGRGVEDARRP